MVILPDRWQETAEFVFGYRPVIGLRALAQRTKDLSRAAPNRCQRPGMRGADSKSTLLCQFAVSEVEPPHADAERGICFLQSVDYS
jgi:hypothetical protein